MIRRCSRAVRGDQSGEAVSYQASSRWLNVSGAGRRSALLHLDQQLVAHPLRILATASNSPGDLPLASGERITAGVHHHPEGAVPLDDMTARHDVNGTEML